MLSIAPLADLFEVDYTMAEDTLFMKIVRLSIRILNNLDILSYVQHGYDSAEHTLSWIPCWDQEMRINPLILDSDKNASRGSTLHAHSDPFSNVLQLRGVHLDTVSSHTTFNHDEVEDVINLGQRTSGPDPHCNLIVVLIRKLEAEGHSGDEITQKVLDYGNSLCAGPHRYWPEGYLDPIFAEYVRRCLFLAGEDPNQYPRLVAGVGGFHWRDYQNAVYSTLVNRALFSTEKGRQGLGGISALPGDEICALFGGRVLYILRDKGGYHQLVGEAYITGLMDGQVMDMLEAGELSSEEYELR